MPVSRMDSGIGGPEGYAASGTVSLLAVLRHALAGYYRRQLHDPIRLIMLFHEIITFVHFITWASSYGGIGGSGPTFVSTWGGAEVKDLQLCQYSCTPSCGRRHTVASAAAGLCL